MSTLPEIAEVAPTSTLLCRNCAHPVTGRYCGECGQTVVQRDRVLDLVIEWLMAFARPDGILWSTLGLLLLNPGRLTRDWWEGRRTLRMSPVRTVFAVVVFGSILTLAQSLAWPRSDGVIGSILQLFVFQTAVVGTAVTALIMPLLLPSRLKRTFYQHVAFALYESAFLGLAACSVLAFIVVSGLSVQYVGDFAVARLLMNPTMSLAPLVLPVLFIAIVVHGVAHVRFAYGLSWFGSAARVIALGVVMFIGSMLAYVILQVTGITYFLVPI
ncbi:DUF3667 domain-containing protein [Brevundimonas goettingensis]|uniref:DUF3667 domain-containing protein n=1 Tax=Brevundimonas goettingensis TaxID=2774190 RepID=UPI001CECC240|nr:DUF3667 domain-containing protein [Brevundimonas goettingensis]